MPTISVGNLSIGGAGKTPHIEYLVRLLKDYIEVATLSRGYQRKTKGYLEVQPNNTATQVGDEPLQYKRKFRDILVVVSESRTFAIPKMLSTYPRLQCVLLDDAFQHRAVKPGLNILLTEWSKPFTQDYLLPSGRLREWRKAYHRADLIIVTKCPQEITADERKTFLSEINPYSQQRLLFSYYKYGKPYHIFQGNIRVPSLEGFSVLLICAIAGSDYLIHHLNQETNQVSILEYEDHHYFNKQDLSNLKLRFDQIHGEKKIIITTEKDAMRLESHSSFILEHKLPIFALPIEVAFNDDDGDLFDEYVKHYLLNVKG